MLAKSQSEIVVSLIIPVETSKGSIISLTEEMLLAMSQISANVEIVVVPVPQSGVTFDDLKFALSSVPNSRVLRLANTSDHDDAVLAGVYSCIGDYVIVADPLSGRAASSIGLLVRRSREGAGVSFAKSPPNPNRFLRPLRSLRRAICRGLFGSVATLAMETASANVFCMSRDVCNLVLSMHPRGWQLRTLLIGFGKPERLIEYVEGERHSIERRLWLRRILGVLRSGQKTGGRINLAVSLIIFAAFLWNIILTLGLVAMHPQGAIGGSSVHALVRINLFVCIAALIAQLMAIGHLVFLSKKRTERTWFIIEEASGTAPSYGDRKNITQGDVLENPIASYAPEAPGDEEGGRRA
ncbi:MAG TPA: hypothetical protein VIT21_03435 [Chthoniobacterales bacterium]